MRVPVPAVVAAALLTAVVPCALAPASAYAQQGSWSALKSRLEHRIAQHHGTVGLVLLDPATGDSLSIRGDEEFPTASNIKIAILIQLFHEVQAGTIHLTDPLVMLDADRIGGSGVFQFFDAPFHVTVKDAATFMIAESDNTATNLLIDKLGIRAVNERMDSLGYHHTRLWAKVSRSRTTSINPDSSQVWGLGVTTPMEMARIFLSLYRGEAVSSDASRQMIGMLRKQFWGYNEIPRYLPADAVVAHKTGSVNASRNDCAIVYAPRPEGKDVFDPPAPGGRDYVLCVFTTKNEDQSWKPVDNAAETLIGDLSRMVWEALEPAGKSPGD
jgi:beta-lactamase class A